MTQDSSINTSEITLNEKGRSGFFTKAMLHNAAFNIRDNLRLMIVLLVLHMAAAPLSLGMLIYNILVYGSDSGAEPYYFIAAATTCGAAAAGIICALSVMPYLYKKSMVDMRLSLPMTTAQRYVSDSLSGLFIYIVPFLISTVFTWAGILIGHLACDGRTFKRVLYDGTTFDTWYCNMFSDAAPIVLKVIVGGIVLMIMFYFFTALVASCCGNLFDCIIYTFLANGLVPGTIAIIIYGIISNVNNLVADFYTAKILPYTSPIGGAIGLVFALENEVSDTGSVSNVPAILTYGKWLVGMSISVIVIAVAAFLIYRNRKAEDTGKPIVFGAFYHIIMTLGLVCLVYAFCIDSDLSEAFLPMIIVTAIIYLVFTVIRNRGFSHFLKGIICYACTMAAAVCSMFIVEETACFGAGKYVPDENMVSEVYISYSGFSGERDNMRFGEFSTTDSPIAKLTESENINKVITVHSKCVDKYEEPIVHRSMRVMYRLKTGKLVVRDLSLNKESFEIITGLDMTEEFREYRCAEAEYSAAKNIESALLGYGGVTLTPQWSYEGRGYNSNVTIPMKNLPEDFCKVIGECMRNDLMHETEEQYFRNEGKHWYLDICSDRFIIKEHHTETLNYLRQCGFDPLPEYTGTIGENFVKMNYEISMVSSDVYKALGGTGSVSTDGHLMVDTEEYGFIFPENYAVIKTDSEELEQLLEAAQKMYKTNESCYTISVDGNIAVIPPKYNSISEELYIRAVAETFFRGDIVIDAMQRESYGEADAERYLERYKLFLDAFAETFGTSRIDSVCGSGTAEKLLEFVKE